MNFFCICFHLLHGWAEEKSSVFGRQFGPLAGAVKKGCDGGAGWGFFKQWLDGEQLQPLLIVRLHIFQERGD